MHKNTEFLEELQNFILSNKEFSVTELLEKIKSYLGENFVQHIFQLNTPCNVIIFKNKADEKFVLKLERSDNPLVTQKEVNWYTYIKDNIVVPAHFPHFFGGYQDKGIAFYFLDYLDAYVPVGTLFVQDKLTVVELVSIANEAIIAVEEMFYKLPRKKDPAIVRAVFAERLQKRYSEMYVFEYLKELLGREEIIINGKSYKNMPFYIEKLVDSPILKDIEDKDLGIIHGDMHFGNILLKEGSPFMFLDPNGALFLPLEYDYSKILYSTQSGYDFLHTGRYKLQQNNKEFEFSLDEHEKRAEVTDNYIKFLGDKAATVWYTNAIHTISSLPHHAKDVEETTATYLQSILILDDLFKR